MRSFKNAQEAFETLYKEIDLFGVEANGTKRIRHAGFYILNPLDNRIETPWRKWSLRYAQREWEWYMSQNRSVADLKRYAPIWDTMHGGDNIVNSNYGFLIAENDQYKKTVQQLKENPGTRQAWISLFDGKNKDQYKFDTPCTLNIGFTIENGRLCMDVLMRSNDLWFGFCNDQFCFSLIQERVAKALGIPVGWYYHFSSDLHVYEAQWDKRL